MHDKDLIVIEFQLHSLYCETEQRLGNVVQAKGKVPGTAQGADTVSGEQR